MNHICKFVGVTYFVINNRQWILIALDRNMYPLSNIGDIIYHNSPDYIQANTLNKFQKEKI